MPTATECPYNRSAFIKEHFAADADLTYADVMTRWKAAGRKKLWCPSRDLYQKVKAGLAKKAAKPITIIHGPVSDGTNEAVLESRVAELSSEYRHLEEVEATLDKLYSDNGIYQDIREALLQARRVVGKHLLPKE